MMPPQVVDGVGREPNEFMIVGSQPGWEEDRDGIAFVGKTGKEVRRFFNGRDLPDFDDVYATNLYKQFFGKDYRYGKGDLDRDLPLLMQELQRVLPKIIVTLGREATRAFLGDVDLDGTQGIAWLLPDDQTIYPCAPDGVVIFPITHPAAAFRNPEMSPYVVNGFQQLSEFLDGQFEARRLYDDPYAGREDYQEITTEAELDRTLAGVAAGSSLHVDTEGYPHAPWSLQYSPTDGCGYLIRASNRPLLQRFFDHVRRLRLRLTFHSALHELSLSRALGIPYTGIPFDDTMIMAYLLQLEPQGLKAGALRRCGMKMMDFPDVMGDAANELAREYLTWLWDGEEIALQERQEAEFIRLTTTPYQDKKGNWKPGRKLKVHPKLPKTQLHKAVQRCLQSVRPRELFEDQIEDVHVAAYKALGPMPEATLDYVPASVAIPYGCRDADATGRLLPHYSRQIDALGLRGVYNLELGTYPLIDRMAMIGLKPDLQHFADLSGVLQYEIDEIQKRLDIETGRPGINANSGDQIAEYLFGDLGLEPLKWTKGSEDKEGRGSTNDKILEALEKEHPEFPSLSTIREFRETYKLKNTFVDRIPDFVHRWPYDGRVHATFRTTRVITGRLAASDPNLLAQPEHGKWASEFKRGWVPERGHVVCAWDESQVELRGLAHLSGDETLLKIYRGEIRDASGEEIDLHAQTAHRIFGGNIKDYMHKCLQRLAAKAVNFGIPMGMTCKGLSVELRKNGVDADEDTAQRWLDDTLNGYPGVKRYMAERIAEVRRTGYIRCMSGRIRYIGGIRSRDDRVREEAERFAFSTPIQESAQYIMKQAEVRVWNEVLPYFWKRGEWVEPLLQVHDCLKMECQKGLEQELHLFMADAMTNVPHSFSVPLAVDGEYGYNFYDVNKFAA